jgi:hypothetical protein
VILPESAANIMQRVTKHVFLPLIASVLGTQHSNAGVWKKKGSLRERPAETVILEFLFI